MGHGKKAARTHRRVPARAGSYEPAAEARDRLSSRCPQHLVLRPTRTAAGAAGQLDDWCVRRIHLRGGPRKASTEDNALFEARRCLSCGNCFECDNCYGICPDNAVIKLGPGERFRFNYDYCKGCGICAEECPCGAIKMTSEVV